MAEAGPATTGSVPAGPYLQAAVQRNGEAILAVLQKLLDIQVCARCCLRFAGVRGRVYAEPAPTQHSLLAAVLAVQGERAAAAAPGAGAALQAGGGPDQAQAASRPCSVCLGVLQGIGSADTAAAAPAEVLAAVQAYENTGWGKDWAAIAGCSAAAVAEAARQQGHAFSSFALDVSVPGATAVRQQAMWHWLRREAAGKQLLAGHSPACDIVDLKEAVRLALAEPLVEQLHARPSTDAQMHVGLFWAHPASAREADFLFGSATKSKGGKRRRGEAQPLQLGRLASEALAQMAAKMLEAKLGSHARIPPLPPAAAAHAFVRCRRDALWVGGYYRKLTRDVSNSRFFLDGKRLGRTSVAEEIQRVVAPHYRCDGTKFSSAGREDLDVRMLGDGRPFTLEMINARAEAPPPEAFAAMEAAINGAGSGVEVHKLQAVTREQVQLIKDGEQEKQKSYLARCRLPCTVTPEHLQKLNATRDLMLQQTTPTRVEHRRAMLVRERLVHSMEATAVEGDPNSLMLRLRTQAGTYIKEFCHGDNGRTLPNLGSYLGCSEPAEILELDVLEIHMKFLP